MVEDGDNAGVDGCSSVDPGFADSRHYHLASRAGFYSNGFFAGGAWVQAGTDSGAIDAGAPGAGYDREPQPNGRRANLGAYGQSPTASKTWLEAPGVFASLTIHAYPASAVGTNFATVSGEVLHAGGAENPSVYLCWGAGDGGAAETGAWTRAEALGARAPWEQFSTLLTGVTGTISYRFWATNSTGSDWSLLESFTMAEPPTVANPGAVSVRRHTAKLRGRIDDTGGSDPTCWFYYWPSGGATTEVAVGTQTGSFTNEMAGLTADTEYGYSVRASNSAGVVETAAAVFRTLGANVGWYVATNGDGTIGTNWPTAFRTLPAVMAVAESGDTVYVAGHLFELQTELAWSNSGVSIRGSYEGVGLPGAYSLAAWPTIFKPQATYSPRLFQLQGVADLLLERLVLDGGYRNATYGANLMMSACTNVTLRDLVVRNGTVYSGAGGSTWGAGAYIGASTNILLANCTITNNVLTVNASDAKGAGLYVTGSDVTVSNSLIRNNRIIPGGWLVPQGVGVYVTGGGLRFIRTIVAQNTTTAGSTVDADGGGIFFASGTHRLVNCLVITNDCVYNGDGLYVANGGVSIENCTIADNRGEGVSRAGGTVAATNTIFWGNGDDLNGSVALGYCVVEDGDDDGVNGCLSLDPLFVDRVYYHEQSKGGQYQGGYFSGGTWGSSPLFSPVIDRGHPGGAYANEPAPNGGRVNIGAYGNTEVAAKSSTSGTLIVMW